ncbi:MAG: aspartate--ammonia ligase, partial [Desulfamplus sp.]|nr:aspartate--ammonia ligase [Desulfamplus sp.]
MEQFWSITKPLGYNPLLDIRQTEKAIRKIKEFFQSSFAEEMNLNRATAPLFVKSGTGINDDLNGIEKPVSFSFKGDGGQSVEIVQSLAKWKRMALKEYGLKSGEGIYTDMNAIRPDEKLDNLHSIYVDQWDWERVIEQEERNLDYLKNTVKSIYEVIKRTERYINVYYPEIIPCLPKEITFIHAEDLLLEYPNLNSQERESKAAEKYGAIFIIGIG